MHVHWSYMQDVSKLMTWIGHIQGITVANSLQHLRQIYIGKGGYWGCRHLNERFTTDVLLQADWRRKSKAGLQLPYMDNLWHEIFSINTPMQPLTDWLNKYELIKAHRNKNCRDACICGAKCKLQGQYSPLMFRSKQLTNYQDNNLLRLAHGSDPVLDRCSYVTRDLWINRSSPPERCNHQENIHEQPLLLQFSQKVPTLCPCVPLGPKEACKRAGGHTCSDGPNFCPLDLPTSPQSTQGKA